MQTLLAIAVFGALGCLLRYGVSRVVHLLFGYAFPYGTLMVNLIGAFLIGLIMEFSLRSAVMPSFLRVGLIVGFFGGLTTFSAFSYETFRLLEEGKLFFAGVNVLGSVTLCLVCTWLGIIAARAI